MAVAPATAPWYEYWLKFLSSTRPTSVTTPIFNVEAEAAADGLAAADAAAEGAMDGAADAAMDGSADAAADGAAGVGVAEPLHAAATRASAPKRPTNLVVLCICLCVPPAVAAGAAPSCCPAASYGRSVVIRLHLPQAGSCQAASGGLRCVVQRRPGEDLEVTTPDGTLVLHDLAVSVLRSDEP